MIRPKSCVLIGIPLEISIANLKQKSILTCQKEKRRFIGVALSPPSQVDRHVALIRSIAPIVPANEVRWKGIVDLAHVIDFGLKR